MFPIHTHTLINQRTERGRGTECSPREGREKEELGSVEGLLRCCGDVARCCRWRCRWPSMRQLDGTAGLVMEEVDVERVVHGLGLSMRGREGCRLREVEMSCRLLEGEFETGMRRGGVTRVITRCRRASTSGRYLMPWRRCVAVILRERTERGRTRVLTRCSGVTSLG